MFLLTLLNENIEKWYSIVDEGVSFEIWWILSQVTAPPFNNGMTFVHVIWLCSLHVLIWRRGQLLILTLWRVNGLMNVMHLAQCLAYSNPMIHSSYYFSFIYLNLKISSITWMINLDNFKKYVERTQLWNSYFFLINKQTNKQKLAI